MGKWANCFKEELEKSDRMKVEPVSLKLKEGYINSWFCSRPYDTPYHLRTMYEKEIKRALDAGHIAPCCLEHSNWASEAFLIPKGDGSAVRIVADFKRLNRHIQRPVWPTENSNQLLRHIDPQARFFATMDLTSGYHQIPIDKESQDLLVISTTPMGRFKYQVLAQGVCSASDIFNYLTDGSMRYDGSESIKNMDDVLLFGRTLEEL